jgi:hypothetical protein
MLWLAIGPLCRQLSMLQISAESLAIRMLISFIHHDYQPKILVTARGSFYMRMKTASYEISS